MIKNKKRTKRQNPKCYACSLLFLPYDNLNNPLNWRNKTNEKKALMEITRNKLTQVKDSRLDGCFTNITIDLYKLLNNALPDMFQCTLCYSLRRVDCLLKGD